MSVPRLKPVLRDGLLNIGTSVLSTAGKSAAYLIGPVLLQPKDFGLYAYLSWIAAIAAILGSTGFVQSGQRFSCQFAETKREFSRFLLRLGIALTVVITTLLLMVPGNSPVPLRLGLATLATAVATAAYLIQQALVQADRDFGSPLRAESGSQLVRLTSLAALKFAGSVAASSLLYVDALMSALKLVLLNVRTSRTDDEPVTIEKRVITHREVLGYSGSILLISILDVVLWQRGEMFFLGRFATLAGAGQFALASQMSQLVVLGPTAAITSLLPRLSERAYGGEKRLDQATSKIVSFALLAAVPLYCGSVIVAPLLLQLWKPEYQSVGAILPELMIGKAALLLSAPLSMALYASGRQRSVFVVVCIAGLLALGTDFFAIRAFGLVGAAWASAANQVFTALATYVAARQFLALKLTLHRFSSVACFVLLGLQIPAAASSGLQFPLALLGLAGWLIVIYREPMVLEHLPSAWARLQTRKMVETNA